MKQYLKYIITTLVLAFVFFEVVVLGIIMIPADVFHSSYQSLIQDKYRVLIETNEPKIIMVCGSSSAFGLDQKMLEEKTGYKVANLGLHAGFGHLFYSELAKANINKGDIVICAYEYGWQNGFDFLDPNLIMTGIDSDIKMYTRIPVSRWMDFIGNIFRYAETKYTYTDASGIYSREAFDSETGQMTMERDYSLEYSADECGTADINVVISDSSREYLIDFKEYVQERGASIYFAAPPIDVDGVTCDYTEMDKLKQLEEEEIGIPYISNPRDYVFPHELMSNAIYHCNTKGEKVRTELLINDLKKYGVIQ